jgi:hypothetical protein
MVSMRFIAPELTVKELTDALVTGTENGAGKLKAAGAERMKFCDQTFEGRREALSQANKLSRTYAALLDALNRHRGKGQQKVTVEHVHVHAGGQAVVGMVQTPGGGDQPKSEDQPHAKQIAHAPGATMPRADAPRQPMPVARDEERALPDARRAVAGRTER